MTALAWTLVHFLWQGTLIAMAAGLLLRRPTLTASTRYLLGVGALFVMLVAPVATFVAESAWRADDDLRRALASVMKAEVVVSATWPSAAQTPPAPPAPEVSRASGAAFIVLPWAVGVTVLLTRLLGGWVVARAVARRVVQPVGADVQAMVARLSGRLALDRVVRVFESAAVVVPVVIGWMRPVVLVPTAALAGLPPAQLEALLAHELAHVRRHDYLVNLLQAVVETLLFYHPGVWWVSRQVRAEREHCCDDIAVSVCDRVEYVSALSSLAAITAPPRLALAATDGRLVSRVRRLLSRAPEEQGAASVWLSAVVAITLVASIPVGMTAINWTTARSERPAVRSDDVAADASTAPLAEAKAPVPAGPAAETADEVTTPEAPVEAQQSAQAQAEGLDLQAYRSRLLEQEKKLADFRQRQRELEVERVQAEFESRRLTLRSEIETAQAALAEARKKVEVGLVASEVPAAYQNQIQMLERQLAAIERDQNYQQRASRLATEETELKRDYESVAQAYARMLAQREERQVEARVAANREGNAAAQVQLQRQAAERLQAAADQLRVRERETVSERTRETEQVRDREALAQRSREAQVRAALPELAERVREVRARQLITDPAATVRVGDVVTVEIHGETDVPTSYTVTAAGAIRLPFMEPVNVLGLTRGQIQAALVQQLQRVKKDVALEVGIRRGAVGGR